VRVVHFEIGAKEPERAVKFYNDVFGWQTQKWGGPQDYWLVQTGPDDQMGINGGIFRCQEGSGCKNTVAVPSVDEFSAKVVASGGQVIQPKMAIPGVGYLAYCHDTEGNTFGIMQFDQAAA
jgi:predicted enzyme related to lactoylglutathione lyase